MLDQAPRPPAPERQIYLREAAQLLNRRMATIRGWERKGILPKSLLPRRDSPRGWRYWTPNQIESLKAWMARSDMRPGKALPHYNPTPAEAEAHIAKTRTREADEKPRPKGGMNLGPS